MRNPWRAVAHMSRQQLQDLQNKKLHHFVNTYLYPFSPHYRKVFDDNNIDPRTIRTIDDLRRIPFTSKRNFIEQGTFKEFVQAPDEAKIKSFWPKSKLLCLAKDKIFKGPDYVKEKLSEEFKPVLMTFTTGTTSTPIPFLYSNYDIQNLHLSGARMVHLFEVGESEILLNIFPYAPHLAFWQVVFGGFSSHRLALSTGGGKTLGREGNLRAIEKMKPTVVLGVPSYVYHLFREAKEQGCQLSYIKKVVLGASRVTTGFKIKLAELLQSMGADHVSVFGTYGFTESRCAWAECPTELEQSSGYFLYPDKEIFEIVDPETGEPKGEGEDGEIVYTSIDSRASSVLRYRTGDFVKGGIVYSECPYTKMCVPRLSSDITRLSDVKDLQLSKIKGALVNLNHFSSILSNMPIIDEWQLEIRKKNDDPYEVDEMVLYLCVQKSCNQDELKDKIKKQMQSMTEVCPNTIEFIDMKEMVKRLGLETENKEKRILDKRPKS